MAITSNCSKFLFYAKSLGVDYSKSLMLGRLNLYAPKKDIEEHIALFKNNKKKIEDVVFKDEYAEPLFEILGAELSDSIDYSDYENPTFVHDMNQPITAEFKNKYTAIIDGGTVEHIFNFPVAIKNCMEMLQVGGHYIGITPANNLMGHGFYQFSPELYYNVFSSDNGFKMIKAVLCAQKKDGHFSDWYEVINPKEVKSRVMFTNDTPAYLMVIAQKIAVMEIFKRSPQQSDYVNVWAISKSLKENKAPENESKLKFLYRKVTPRFIKIFLHNVYNMFTKQTVVEDGLGEINPDQFKKINF